MKALPDTLERQRRSARHGMRISATALAKSYGPVQAVAHVELAAEPGRILGLLGPNGAGKSTTLRMMLGLTRPTSGSVTFDGMAYADIPGNPVRRVGATLTSDAFGPRRTAWRHLWCWAPLAGADSKRIDEVLEIVGLSDAAKRPVGQFSLGMRQRLALATALLGDPSVLVLDEPANGLDPHGIFWLRRFLRQFADDGGTVVLSSHLLGEVEQMVDDVVLIDKGAVVWRVAMSSLTAEAAWSVLLVEDVGTAVRALDRHDIRYEAVGRGLRVMGDESVVSTALAGMTNPGAAAVVLPGNLESLFLALTDDLAGVTR